MSTSLNNGKSECKNIAYTIKSHPSKLLKDHLEGVLQICDFFTNNYYGVYFQNNEEYSILKKITYIIALCHDFGKITPYFQEYIQNIIDEKSTLKNSKYKNHSLISAYFTYYVVSKYLKSINKLDEVDNENFKNLPYFSYLIVKRHHGNIKNAKEERVLVDDDLINLQKDSIVNGKKEYVEEINLIYNELFKKYGIFEDEIDILEFFGNLMVPGTKSINYIVKKSYKTCKKSIDKNTDFANSEDIEQLQYMYSILLTADKMDAGNINLQKNSPMYSKELIEPYIQSLNQKNTIEPNVKNIKNINKNINDIRNDIFNDLKNRLNNINLKENHVLSLNLPTGTGKTLLSYYTAFHIANELNKKNIFPKIIYSLPFTTVIDQNYEVLEKLLHMNNENTSIHNNGLIKYHSLAEIPDNLENEAEEEFYNNSNICDKNSKYLDYNIKFSYDNWQGKVIVTTFVQLFNTFFKLGLNKINHRYYNLRNSIIILDEIQAINPSYYKIINKYLNMLCEKYGIYIILATATMTPLFDDSMELVSSKKYFEKLNRITLYNKSKEEINIEDFKELVLNDILDNENNNTNNTNKSKDKFLIVMNTVNSARQVYEFMSNKLLDKNNNYDGEVIYLSTEVAPKKRMEIIDKIKDKENRNKNRKYVVVSTQLVEAGVDIDMDVIYRDFAPIDSITQTSGRANRNGANDEKGIIYIYKVTNEKDKCYSKFIYPAWCIQLTKDILNKQKNREISENEFQVINETYQHELHGNRISYIDSNKMEENLKELNIKSFRDSFNLIDNNYRIYDIYLNYDNEFNEIIGEIEKELLKSKKNNIKIKNLFKKLNKYKISISKDKYYNIKDNLKELSNLEIEIVNKEYCEGGYLRYDRIEDAPIQIFY
ncbi:CRISPR-associated helicase/endonuclease Cas3 [Methanococcus voltae]|uniref:CRISPR-associated helicase Cas3 n=1 Tax=Methanococcus voltae (strain ATCC BAA-1334 / A3) TaxID=456320 RepID=D7DSS7_METV3|nr:CRISPR-associated helicase/endonuclease Cas3 [Methanococcus voltae]MCS3901788.1 CRISPR-associated endonuclease/helicase Cas3 [Methanococcus voltae]